jgi:4-hydroxy-3-polyprenylbenzoate decarboxylase
MNPGSELEKRVIIAITGASGTIFGVRLLEILTELGYETHLVVSKAARLTLHQETDWTLEDVLARSHHSYDPQDLSAQIASGSFVTRGMLIVPCSVKTLAAVANSYSENLISRSADVCLKEGRPLLLGLRETPLHRGHLRLMDQAARAGAIIFPLAPAFYGRQQTTGELVNGLVGRMLLRVGIENRYYHRWGEK